MNIDTYGELRLNRTSFIVAAEPPAMIMLKRHFPRLRDNYREAVHLKATDETAHLLRWFCQGYPLAMSDEVRRELNERADRFEAARQMFRRAAAGALEVRELVELSIPLREYQQVGVALARASGGLLLADQMGLGKTLQAIGLIAGEPRARPALVVCELHLVKQWMGQLRRAAPSLRAHAVRKGRPYNVETDLFGCIPRGALSQPFRPERVPDVLVIPYSKLHGWADVLAGVVQGVVYDEVQSLRKGASTAKGAAARAISEGAAYRLGLSGTPVYNYGSEIHAIVEVLKPDALGNRDEFLREWCELGASNDNHRVRDPRALGIHLRNGGVILRRTRADVGRELPELAKVPEEVPADRKALDAMKGRAAELARLVLDRRPEVPRFERMRAAEELSSLVRQVTGVAKAPYVASFVAQLVADGLRPVVFGWHHEVYGIWRHMWADAEGNGLDRPLVAGWHTGRESVAEKQQAIDNFIVGRSDVLVMSLRSGAGVDGLQHATDTVVFGELDWSPQVHDQCVTRVYRDGQTRPVTAFYCWADAGSDPIVLDVLGAKRSQSDPMVDPSADVLDQQTDEQRVARLAEHVVAGRLLGVDE